MQTPAEYSKRLAINDIACAGSKLYYTDMRNYYNNLREILAEYNGIVGTKEYLDNEFSGIDAEKLLVDYVNFRGEMDAPYRYFVRYGVTSMSDIKCVFDDAFVQAYS
jgi:hypothetical protein